MKVIENQFTQGSSFWKTRTGIDPTQKVPVIELRVGKEREDEERYLTKRSFVDGRHAASKSHSAGEEWILPDHSEFGHSFIQFARNSSTRSSSEA